MDNRYIEALWWYHSKAGFSYVLFTIKEIASSSMHMEAAGVVV